MAKNSNPSAFDRDFGYLMPFLDRVAAAASDLEDASARAELTRLMVEEKARWQRIQELLGGAGGRGAAAPTPAREAPAEAPRLARGSADELHEAAPFATGLTVGSLRGSR
ncbi:hypothetical protein MXAN_2410 [Myxococcus xanthus DK 1622]|uniref:Encapsulin nanocompartment cargo protein EncD n=1 Tax=Myxococcus xanthus (strain DK1622) TaxID=246197 RepID=ENCD_MYXXD|nr:MULTISPECIES: encapsulin nanocompartment cargo protein EncD [Myxococcus]Q1D9P3.1 RecName: Full=Encapsulin nanocompartment cargo protein EncD [Myxococcus xanthus DK 1622]ABF90650.1 hypothetical protein MXAN_2410 [Myxococcus xanthus DK 1622]NOJ53871.1 hypothetical protein [Myxococcus xanthus]QPM81930.1 hypothetical protein I5Q59_11945 [Myxococcus xanthus]QVW71179.1 hypothetical protein JTM82_17300 [Myxococcus xanthus DZ2]QZZ50137.1 hypothetical protein MyxoNM_13085 [Myxococcus xanthus]